MGLTCHRPASTKGIGSMTCRSGEFFSGGRCYKKCPTGYTNMGATCHRPASTKGIGSMTCKPNEFISGGRCYKECPAGYTNMGATCHRPASTKGIETMTCKPGELISIGRCYKCSADREYYGGLCYKKCPEGSDRTAISTCAHHVKLRGNTHLWMVDHGLDLLKTSSDPIAQRAVARMNNPKCRTQWEKGLWDMDASPYADTPEGSSRGSHFYNGAKKDAWGDPTSITTYALLGVDVTENIDGTFNPDAQQTAASNISAISNLMGSEDDCNKLGRALHYMTDMTQPMHTSGFSGISIPTMLHPVFEFYVPYVQNKFPVNVSWTERWTDLSPNDAFHKASVQSNSLSPKLMKSLKYDGTICTINVEGIVYTGYCFINDKKVDEQIGIVLRDGYQSVASYIYTVFKDKAPAGRANLRQAPLSNSNADYSGEFRVKVKADNLFWHCDGGSERKLVSTKWQPTDDYTRFIFERQSSGYYRIRVKADNRYLHVDGGNPQQPLSTQWQPESTDACTHFLLEKNTDGSFRIKVKCTGKYLFEEGNTPNKLLSTKNQVDATSTNTHFYLVGE